MKTPAESKLQHQQRKRGKQDENDENTLPEVKRRRRTTTSMLNFVTSSTTKCLARKRTSEPAKLNVATRPLATRQLEEDKRVNFCEECDFTFTTPMQHDMVHSERVATLRAKFTREESIIPKTSLKLPLGRLVDLANNAPKKLLAFADNMFGVSATQVRHVIVYCEIERICGFVVFFEHDKACPVVDTQNWLVDSDRKFEGKLGFDFCSHFVEKWLRNST